MGALPPTAHVSLDAGMLRRLRRAYGVRPSCGEVPAGEPAARPYRTAAGTDVDLAKEKGPAFTLLPTQYSVLSTHHSPEWLPSQASTHWPQTRAPIVFS